jgi:hypothetical protein
MLPERRSGSCRRFDLIVCPLLSLKGIPGMGLPWRLSSACSLMFRISPPFREDNLAALNTMDRDTRTGQLLPVALLQEQYLARQFFC